MTDTTRDAGATIPRQPDGRTPEPTGWVGWIFFAGTLMVMLGIFHAIQGLVALFKDEYYAVGTNGLVVSVDYTAWGWTHLLLGVVVAAAGAGLWVGQTWARVVAVVLSIIREILNIAFVGPNTL
jgi:hypothetical protein